MVISCSDPNVEALPEGEESWYIIISIINSTTMDI